MIMAREARLYTLFMRLLTLFLIPALITIPLSGCWESSDLDNIAYIQQVAATYEKGKYHVWLGVLNMTQVAETSVKPSSPGNQSPIWLAESSGNTFLEAINKVYPTSPKRLSWSQFTVLILHDSVLHGHLRDVLETLNRYREVRYTLFIYGIHSSVKWVFTSQFPIEKNPLFYYISNPIGVRQFGNVFPPIRLNKLIRELNEPGSTPLLPEILPESKKGVRWYSGKKTIEAGSITSVGVFANGHFAGWLKPGDAAGLLWARTGGVRIPLLLHQPSPTFVYLHFNKVKIKPIKKGLRFYYRMTVTGKADIAAISKGSSDLEIAKALDQQITKDIRKSFLAGVKHHSDVFNLGQVAYRHLFLIWPVRSQKKVIPSLALQADSLQDIVVHINITHAGMRDLSEADFSQK